MAEYQWVMPFSLSCPRATVSPPSPNPPPGEFGRCSHPPSCSRSRRLDRCRPWHPCQHADAPVCPCNQPTTVAVGGLAFASTSILADASALNSWAAAFATNGHKAADRDEAVRPMPSWGLSQMLNDKQAGESPMMLLDHGYYDRQYFFLVGSGSEGGSRVSG